MVEGAGEGSDRERDARELLRKIGAKFVAAKREPRGRAKAFRAVQNMFMENLDVLVLGGVISLDQLMKTVGDLEEFLTDTASGAPDEMGELQKWLNEMDQEVV